MIRRFPVRISALTDERDVDGVAQALAPFDVIDLVGRAQRSLCGLVDWGRFSVPVNAQHCPLGESVASERIGVDLELPRLADYHKAHVAVFQHGVDLEVVLVREQRRAAAAPASHLPLGHAGSGGWRLSDRSRLRQRHPSMIGLVASFQLSAPTRMPDMGASHRSCAKELRGRVGVFTPWPAPPLFVACAVRRVGLPHAITALQEPVQWLKQCFAMVDLPRHEAAEQHIGCRRFGGQGAPLRPALVVGMRTKNCAALRRLPRGCRHGWASAAHRRCARSIHLQRDCRNGRNEPVVAGAVVGISQGPSRFVVCLPRRMLRCLGRG
jgi:hypothetical protein